MNEAKALRFELMRAHRGDQLGGASRSEDKCDARSAAPIASSSRDEIEQRRSLLAARKTTAVAGIFAASRGRAIRRIGDDKIEAGGLDACDFARSKIGSNSSH